MACYGRAGRCSDEARIPEKSAALKPLEFSRNDTPQRSAALYEMAEDSESAIHVWLALGNPSTCGDVLRITNSKQFRT